MAQKNKWTITILLKESLFYKVQDDFFFLFNRKASAMSMGTVPSRPSSRASTATGVTNASTVPSNATTVPSNVTTVPSNVTAVSDATTSVATGVSKATEASGAASSVATGVSMATDVSKASEGKGAENSVASGVSMATAAADDLAMTLTGASVVGSGKWTNDGFRGRPG